MVKIGDIIKNYRDENNLSLREFAQKCGVSHSYIDKLEKGYDPRNGKKVEPTIETLSKIVTAMGIPLEKLLLDTGYIETTDELFDLKAAADFVSPLVNFYKKHPDILNKKAEEFRIETGDADLTPELYISQLYNYDIDDIIEELNSLEEYGVKWTRDNNAINIWRNGTNLTKKDERDIEKIIEQTKQQLLQNEGLMFDGEPASPEAIQSILDAMRVGLEIGKQRNKEKYTPKKYKKRE